MSRNGRLALIVAALVVAVLAFVIASPGDDDEGGEQAAQTTTQAETGGEETAPAETETEAETAEPIEPPEPEVTRISIRGGEVVGGPADITVKKGDVVRIVVAADAPDDIHLHGYDIEKPAAPAQPARFKVKADIEGSFEMESHVAEDAGRDPLVARLNVEPR
jgi:plastocyanin